MEWRQQTSVSCADAFNEAQRWIEEVTGKSFGCNDFRAALENGVLLCDLINQLKPGIIKRVNRLSTPIAGLDNVNVFLKACGKLGLNVSQLFHPGDLQDLSTRANLRRDESNRRLKNVLITIYWLGRKANLDAFYSGPQLNFKAFEGLLGLALSKALDEGSNVFVKDGWYPERTSYKTENSADGTDSLESRVLRPNSDGCGSDAEAEQVFKMENTQPSTPQNKGCIQAPLLRRKQGWEANGRGSTSPLSSIEDAPFSPQPHLTVCPPECVIDEELFLRALCEEDSEDDYTDADPVLDDLYFRRLQQTLHQTSNNPDYDRFLPRYWTPEEETRVRTIYLGSQRRPWYRKMQGLRSKSLSDIPMVYPVRKVPDGSTIYDVDQDAGMAGEWNQEDKRKCSVAAKDSEAQWHDDLNKWKNRRRSTKSDLRRKSQDRDHVINQMSNGAVTKSESQGGLLKRDQQSPRRHNPAPRPYPTSPPTKSSSSDLRPHTRALLARSYATEVPFSPTAPLSSHSSPHTQGSSVGAMPASDGNILGEETHLASLASDGAGVTTPSLDCPFSSQTQVKAQGSPAPSQPTSELAKPENVFTNQISTLTTTLKPNVTTKSTNTRDPPGSMWSHKELPSCADAVSPPGGDPQEDLSHQSHKSQEEIQKTSWEPAVEQGRGQQAAGSYKFLSRAGSWSSSASLPRGYRRSEGSSRLSSAITARPFGTKQSRVSSLPRLCNVDNNQGVLLKDEKEESLSPATKSSLKRQTATAHLETPHQASLTHRQAHQVKQNGTEQGEEVKAATLSSQISFQPNGYHHQPYTQTQLLPQPYSNQQTHYNKSSTLPSEASVDLLKVDHSDMRVSLSLKPNSRPDFGFQTHWDSTGARVKYIQPGSPAELCQLCVDDEIVAVNGVSVAHMNYNQWKDKMTSSLQTGSLTMDIRRYGNKDWSTSEGSHHNQQGQSRVTLNLTTAAPILMGCPDHQANSGASTETAVRTVSKFNGQTDNVLQGKVMHGELGDNHKTARSKDFDNISRKNQKRRAEFFKEKGGSESAISDLQVPSLSPSSSSWSWDREEDRRRQEKWQEEQERLLQEQYKRDQERLESEWRRAQQEVKGELYRKSGQNTFEMTNGGERPASTQPHVNGLTNKSREEERSPDRDELKVTGSKPQSKAQGEQHDKITEHAWAKSLSTPALAGPHQQARGDEKKRLGQSASKAEIDRQQILEEMKKRTQLLTDNSWIRQRSSSFYKEPIYVGVPMKRYESLDNLDIVRQSPLSAATFSYPRPHSAAAGYCAPSRNASSRYSTGALLSQRNTFDSSHPGSVWAATDISEELRPESRFESEMGGPTVSPAISDSSSLVPPPCDQHAVLQIIE
ncbi:LIM domain only protein 7-like isoform X3 [Epinephelus moara]|uniref:LIM domain only protein 7-like isoform X3 n=1 Tax=Epinephelus moara TaxID=300413 RepID=UPI00214F0E0B|nr:LIM domain only protein 7-like isoform X3 [Epinephelus moara]